MVVVVGAAVLAVAFAAAPSQPPATRPLVESGPGVVVAANTDGHVAGSSAVHDRSPAECVAVRVRAGVVLRLSDPESGVRGFRATRLSNAVLTPSGKSLPKPVAQSDVRVWLRAPWFQAGASISHVNGAGIAGSCFVVSAPDGTLSTIPWH
ncbi:MAG: hypothetical protein ABIO48_10535 [Pedococcus sp.]